MPVSQLVKGLVDFLTKPKCPNAECGIRDSRRVVVSRTPRGSDKVRDAGQLYDEVVEADKCNVCGTQFRLRVMFEDHVPEPKPKGKGRARGGLAAV